MLKSLTEVNIFSWYYLIVTEKYMGSFGSISVTEQLRTYPSPNPTLTLTCYQLTFIGLGKGCVISHILTLHS